ncbi:hypothetical protein B4099_2404 [Heyndrickxia coagulans]|uniref:Uncharacterized protein n=1 Tax=Heyndrickxia coagulans TaxID=1398 RepID=A0A150KD78_HEYCO|nr:hypothetical protein B4099_2404 [Heyndrickxia coagulans]
MDRPAPVWQHHPLFVILFTTIGTPNLSHDLHQIVTKNTYLHFNHMLFTRYFQLKTVLK